MVQQIFYPKVFNKDLVIGKWILMIKMPQTAKVADTASSEGAVNCHIFTEP